MVITHVVEGFRQRGSWVKMREVFQICDLPMGRGWDKTASRLIDEQNLNQDENFDDKIDLLSGLKQF